MFQNFPTSTRVPPRTFIRHSIRVHKTLFSVLLFQFETDPITVSSFTIFVWIYNPSTHFDGIFAFGTTLDVKKANFVFQTGWHSQTGRGQLILRKNSAIRKSINDLTWPNGKWIYAGVSFDANNGKSIDYRTCALLSRVLYYEKIFLPVSYMRAYLVCERILYASISYSWSKKSEHSYYIAM